MAKKPTDNVLSDAEIAERMERAVRRSLTMKPMHRPGKPKVRPPRKERRKDKPSSVLRHG
jgi:hypothetical protein